MVAGAGDQYSGDCDWCLLWPVTEVAVTVLNP